MDNFIAKVSEYLNALGTKKMIFILIIIIAVAYLNSLSVFFVWDDYALIVSNPDIRGKSPDYLFKPVYPQSRPGQFMRPVYFRPLQSASYWVDFRIWKLNAFGYHVTNIILHIANALCVFWLLRILCKSSFFAFAGAALFGVNPLFTSSVTYISGRADLLLLFFSLVSLLCFIRSIATENGNFACYFLSVLSFILALLSKETAFMTLILLGIVGATSYRSFGLRILLRRYIPFVLIAVIFQFFKPLALPGFKFPPHAALGAIIWFFTALKGLFVYTALSIFPYQLHMGRSITAIEGIGDVWLYIALLFTAALVVFSLQAIRRKKIVLFGLVWFYGTLILQIVFNGLLARRGKEVLLPEHNLYFCYAGLLICACSFIGKRVILAKKYLIAVFLCVLAVYTVLTMRENTVWQDEIKLFRRNIAYSGDSAFNFISFSNLGFAYERKRDFGKAEENFIKAAQDSGGDPYFYRALAGFYYRRGEAEKARKALEAARSIP